MISKKMQKAINDQINRELYSSYLYRAMGFCAKTMVLNGTAHWMGVQAGEETKHAERFIKYLQDQQAEPEMQALAKPPAGFKSMLDMFEQTLKHEKYITKNINNLMQQALAEKDAATQIMLQWFITEQIEEEATPAEIIAQLKMVGTSSGGLYMLDKTLGKRE
jgi:ferritin